MNSELRFYNTKSRQVEVFKSLALNKVNLYTCGPTVYGSLHIGNWLAYIRWDILVRVLKLNGYKVNRVLNITDVGHLVSDADDGEDKLEVGARRENLTAYEVAKKYENEFYEGMSQLGLVPADKYARATDYIDEQLELIKRLEQKGFTYVISDGVYFDTSKFNGYSDFARLDLKGQSAGTRVELNTEKRQPWDFALWKFCPLDKKRDMEWDSPWGKGFPGWHLECSAIALNLLGDTLDIHTGGIDHIAVHHTNEIAQSESATNKTFANYWLHNNFLLVEEVKFSKSLQNGIGLEDLKDQGYTPLDFKMLALQSHYRSEAHFSFEVLDSASQRLKALKAMAVLRYQPIASSSQIVKDFFIEKQVDITKHLNSDLNTPMALSVLSEVVEQLSTSGIQKGQDLKAFEVFLDFLDSVLGFDLLKLTDITSVQKDLIKEREAARANKKYDKSDEIREKLKKQGISLNDLESSTIWFYD